MSVARERIDTTLRYLSQRDEKLRQALAAWQRSVKRCLGIAQTLMEGTTVTVGLENEAVTLKAKHGARAVFGFDYPQVALVGSRAKSADEELVGFFSVKIEPPPRLQGQSPHQWGPTRPDGVSSDVMAKIGTQEAFEKALADWFEWAHIGDGAPPAGA